VHVDLLRDKARAFPVEGVAEGVSSLRVWHCGYQTLAPVGTLVSLRHLVIAKFPDETFDALAQLENLESLRVLHFPKVRSLSPLVNLRKLRSISLECLPSWDASSKRLVVESLGPLAQLPELNSIHLLGVVPPSRSLAELEQSQSLRLAQFHGYSKAETARFFQATRVLPSGGEA
jgi:hypothetical protein